MSGNSNFGNQTGGNYSQNANTQGNLGSFSTQGVSSTGSTFGSGGGGNQAPASPGAGYAGDGGGSYQAPATPVKSNTDIVSNNQEDKKGTVLLGRSANAMKSGQDEDQAASSSPNKTEYAVQQNQVNEQQSSGGYSEEEDPERERRRKRKQELQNQLSNAESSRVFNRPKRTEYSSNGRIMFPSQTSVDAGLGYPLGKRKETEQETRERMNRFDSTGRKQELIRRQQAKAVIDDLRNNGYPTWDIRRLIDENDQANDSGRFNNPKKDAAQQERIKYVRKKQYEAMRALLDEEAKNHVSQASPMLANEFRDQFAEDPSYIEDLASMAYEEFGPDYDTQYEAFQNIRANFDAERELRKIEEQEREELLEEERNKRNPPKPKTSEQAAEEAKEDLAKEYIAIETNKVWLNSALKIEGSTGFNPITGRCEFSDTAMKSLNIIGGMYGLDPTNYDDFIQISKLIKLCTGLGCDKSGNVFDSSHGDFEMSETRLKQAVFLISTSQNINGNPFGISVANTQVTWGGSSRYPVGCIDIELAEALRRDENSVLHSMTAQELQRVAMEEWVKEDGVQAALAKHCAISNDDKMFEQWASIEHMIMAICERNNLDSNKWNVETYSERRQSSIINSAEDLVRFTGDPDSLKVIEERAARGSSRYLESQSRLKARSSAMKTADYIFTRGTSIIRGSRIALELPLFATAEAEHFINNVETKAINKLIYGTNRNSKEFVPTKNMYKIAESERYLRSFAALTALRESGGWDAFEAFRESGLAATEENIRQWVSNNSYRYIPETKAGQNAVKAIDSVANAFENAFNVLMPGDIGFAKPDSRLFIDCLMAEQCRRDGLKASEIEKQMIRNPNQFLLDVLSTNVGKDAYVSTKALYAGRISPLPELLKAKLERNGVTDATVSLIMQSWYVHYGMKAFELWVPFSNTISLAVAKGFLTRTSTGVDVLENAVGGSGRDNAEAFRKALLYDCVKLSQNTMQALFIAALIGLCGGLQPPEDDEGNVDMEKFYLPWEWTIQFPWDDQRAPIKQKWYMDDILQGSGVAAVALSFMDQASHGAYDIKDPYLAAAKMFKNGVTDIFGSNQVFEVGSIMLDLFWCGKDIYRFATNQDEELGEHIASKIDKASHGFDYMLADWLAGTVNRSTPMFISDMYPWMWTDDYARNYWTDLEGKQRSPWSAAWNKYAVNNPCVAALANFFSPGHTFGRSETDYQYRSDKTAEAYVENNSYKKYLSDGGLKDNDDSKAGYAKWLITKIDEVGGAKNAQENGILVSYEDYKIVRDYLNEQVADTFTKIGDTNRECRNGVISYSDKKIMNDSLYSDYYELKNMLNGFEYESLVYDKNAYIEVAGTYVYNPTTGKSYNYGDKKTDSSLLPWISPQKKTPGDDYMASHWGTEIGNDFQTNSYLDSSDSSKSMLTSGARNLVANKDNRNVKGLMDDTHSIIDEWEKNLAELKESESSGGSGGGSYGGSRSYSRRSYGGGGGGGGGGSYAPKIYSNPAHMSNPKAATMYSKTPYNTSTSYLNPTVYTSGSRGSYSRREG